MGGRNYEVVRQKIGLFTGALSRPAMCQMGSMHLSMLQHGNAGPQKHGGLSYGRRPRTPLAVSRQTAPLTALRAVSCSDRVERAGSREAD